MAAPKDPYMLISWVNMKLRDTYPSLSELAAAESVEADEIRTRLEGVGYRYDEEKNQFTVRQD